MGALPPHSGQRSRWRQLATALVTTLVLTALALAFLDLAPGEIGAAVATRLEGLRPWLVLLAFGIYAGSYLGRGLRLALLLPGATGVPHLATIAARHNFLNLVLPFRSGEAALPWLLKAESGRPYAEGAAALLVARMLDLLCVAAWAGLGLAWHGLGADAAHQAGPRVAVVLVALALLLAALRPGSRWCATRLRRGQPGRLRDFLVRALGHLAAQGTGPLAGAVLTSLATWLATYATFYVLLQAMAGSDPVGLALAEVDFPRSLVGTTGLHLSTVLPVNTLGAVGSWEAFWSAGYVLLAGLDTQAAGVSAVVTHLAILVFVSLLGGLGFLLRRRPGAAARQAAAPAEPEG